MFVNRKSVQLVVVIHMLIGLTDIFAKHTRQKVRIDMIVIFQIIGSVAVFSGVATYLGMKLMEWID